VKAAVAALEKALDKRDVTVFQAATTELMPLYIAQARPGKAKALAQEAVDLDPTTFEADFLMTQLRQLDQATQPFKVDFGYRYEHDSNAPLVSDDAVVASGQSDWRHVLMGDVLLEHNLGNGLQVFGEAHLYQSLYHDLDELNLTQQNYVASLGWSEPRFGLRLPVEYTELRQDGDAQLQQWTVSPGVYYQVWETATLYGFGRFDSNDYNEDIESPAEDRSGTSRSLGLLFRWGLPATGSRLRVLLEAGRNDADGRNWDGDWLSIYLYGTYRVLEKLRLGLGFDYQDFDYDNVHDVFLVKRDDEVYSVYASLSYLLAKGWELQLQAAYQDGDSNIDVFSFERTVFSMGFGWRY
jgi:hypothetical protein